MIKESHSVGEVSSSGGHIDVSVVELENAKSAVTLRISDPSNPSKDGYLITVSGSEFQELKMLVLQAQRTKERLVARGMVSGWCSADQAGQEPALVDVPTWQVSGDGAAE